MVHQTAEHERSIKLVLRRGIPHKDNFRKLSTEDITKILTNAGFEEAGSRGSFRELVAAAFSAEQLFNQYVEADISIYGSKSSDIIWLSICVLWERWAPDIPSFDLLDDSMQHGYDLLAKGDNTGLEEWEQTWRMYKTLATKGEFDSIDSFDDTFGGLQYVSNWIQDYSDALSCRINNVPERQEKRIAFLQDALSFSVELDEHTKRNFTGDLAQELIDSGSIEKGDELFENTIASDPSFAWNYIWWSDAYGLFATENNKDYQKALSILERGLCANIKDSKTDLKDRLRELLDISDHES
jgi:tetratricopeptide (TPR) repeat protein